MLIGNGKVEMAEVCGSLRFFKTGFRFRLRVEFG